MHSHETSGSFQASHPPHKTYIFARKRDPTFITWPDCVPIDNARYGEHAIGGRIAIFARVLLYQ
jgi:hypothetical protein